MPTPKLTPEIITAAIEGFESQKRRIDDQIAALRAMLSGGTAETAATPEAPTGKRKKFSAAARKRMKEAQQRRWAKIREESEPPAPVTPEPPKRKRRISKAGRARIIAATKERWARVRAAKAQQEKAARKAARKKATVKKAVVKKSAAKKTAPVAAQAAANMTERGDRSYWHVPVTTLEGGLLAINTSKVGTKTGLEPYRYAFKE